MGEASDKWSLSYTRRCSSTDLDLGASTAAVIVGEMMGAVVYPSSERLAPLLAATSARKRPLSFTMRRWVR